MTLITIQIDPQDYFQEGKKKITEGFECLHHLVQLWKHSLSPENDGILHETMTYLQSLPPRIQEIECVAQQGGAAPASFNVHGTDLQHGQTTVIESVAPQGDAFVSNPHVNDQEITQRGQNVNFKLSPNPEINMKKNKKQKLRSDVWNYFSRFENKGKKVKAQCQHCKKYFDGSSNKGTTHLRNHLKSCLKNQKRVANKIKESVVDQELHDSDFVQKLIERFNNIQDDIFEVYWEEKNKLYRYLDKLPGRFNVTIVENFGVEYVMIWYIDDTWKLKTRIIYLVNYYNDREPLNEGSLKCLLRNWNIDKRILSLVDLREDPSRNKVQLTNWFTERVSLPVIGNYKTHHHFFSDSESVLGLAELRIDIMFGLWQFINYYMGSPNKYDDVYGLDVFEFLDRAMGYKEVLCELNRTDPDFTSSNFDWDHATGVHSFYVLHENMKNDLRKLGDRKLANEYFPMVYDSFFKMLRFKNIENAMVCREIFDEYFNNIVIVITVILDPRFKLDIVEHFYNEVYGNEGDLRFKGIMDDVRYIYDKYAARAVNNSSMVIAYANEASSSKSELDRYLTDDKVPPHEGFDILEWWRVNSPTYPTLAMIARDFLSIPILYSFDDARFEDGFADIHGMGFDVGLKNALACIKVWLNDHDCM